MLEAFAQVADTLRALGHDAALVDAERQALDAAEASLRLQRFSYAAGRSDILRLLDAERSYQQARLGYARATAQRYVDSAQLFVALGGGWWEDPELCGNCGQRIGSSDSPDSHDASRNPPHSAHIGGFAAEAVP